MKIEDIDTLFIKLQQKTEDIETLFIKLQQNNSQT